jgi:multiple sugar transport system permease protein
MTSRGKWQESIAAAAFLAPNLVGFFTFTAFPVVASALLSFFDWDIIQWPPRFVGLDNYIRLLGFTRIEDGRWLPRDPLFWKYTWNTLFLMFAIPVNMMGSLALAWILNQRLRGLVYFRTMVFLPSISSAVAIALLWTWLYNPHFGLINHGIQQFGRLMGVPLAGPQWLTDPGWAKPALMLMGFWTLVGGMNMIYYLAALQGIPQELYEAAEIDGASAWRVFWAVTWPMLSPTTFFILTMSIIGGFQGGFLNAYIMTRGGPNGATTTLEYYIFNNLYVYQHAGYAAAIAWILFLAVLGVTIVHWRRSGKWVFYGT